METRDACEACTRIPDTFEDFRVAPEEVRLPEGAERLEQVSAPTDDYTAILRCPGCGAFFLRFRRHEYLHVASEEEIALTRLATAASKLAALRSHAAVPGDERRYEGWIDGLERGS